MSSSNQQSKGAIRQNNLDATISGHPGSTCNHTLFTPLLQWNKIATLSMPFSLHLPRISLWALACSLDNRDLPEWTILMHMPGLGTFPAVAFLLPLLLTTLKGKKLTKTACRVSTRPN